MTVDILVGNCLDILPTLPAGSVHCVVTSPPYLGLRDYLHPDQIGLEDSHAAYVARMVDVFAEVRRVLRDDGTVWLNIGDSYNGSGGAGGDYAAGGLKDGQPRYPGRRVDNLKPKDLIGIPWRLAFALQDAGWWLRSEITWAKRAPMPESVTDRPTSATEKIFLLTKSARYFYDAEAVKEENSETSHTGGQYRNEWKYAEIKNTKKSGMRVGVPIPRNGRNMRNFWLLSPEPYKGSHFATFPTEIPRRAILAGTSARGACPECGAPWKRVVEKELRQYHERGNYAWQAAHDSDPHAKQFQHSPVGWRKESVSETWQPTCTCANNADTVPCTVLDPFLGSGTTLAVAQTLGRSGIGIELNPQYAELARERIGKAQPALLALDTLEIA